MRERPFVKDEAQVSGAGATLSASLRARVHAVLAAHWVPEGYASPHAMVYPWQWLWDSCFHALIWTELGEPERAVTELASALGTQTPDGFVPHMNYVRDPSFHAAFWGRPGTSSITQPPMFGHALADLARRGVDVPGGLVERAVLGLRFLLDVRPRHEPSGLVPVAHPWETGCDDSPRWDDLCPGDGFEWTRWKAYKGDLVAAVRANTHGSAVGNDLMSVAPASFNALVAFNAVELGELSGDDDLVGHGRELAARLDERWDGELVTWTDAGDTERGSGRVRTVDSLLPALVTTHPSRARAALEACLDPLAFGGAFGPAAVHRAEPDYDPGSYWRGPAWPQLSYLLWVAARRRGLHAIAASIASSTVAGASRSGLAEYWHPHTGEGLGAIPQSWTGLAVVMDAAGGRSA